MTFFQKLPVFQNGFRPFFLLASFVSFLSMTQWLAAYFSISGVWGMFDPLNWHAHEMIFGFGVAVLAGFLLTASPNWSRSGGISANKIMFLALLWVLGRGHSIVEALHLLDLAFIPALSYVLLPHLWVKENTRNRKILFLLVLLWISDILMHSGRESTGKFLALDIFVGFTLLISGRVIPFFRASALGEDKIENIKFLEVVAAVTYGVFMFAQAIQKPWLRETSAAVSFFAHFIRWVRWKPWTARTNPILAILYLGYFWIVLGFGLNAIQAVYPAAPSLATHVFAIGAMGVLINGMMTRVSLGHTGRKIYAGPMILVGYLFINLSLIFRSIMPFIFERQYFYFLITSGVLWIATSVVFLIMFIRPLALESRRNS